ncbi:retropepsin-like aspartic protease [Sphingomonas profundi]|uniref:retropepsin-like aspartic protease n=1 Tax=Alterirhizorhabdus profundi TaxID=2681549 RepID=UPI0018D09E0F|nr:retropepsin-like aspartic protease [Sphingomonas profundi]
MSPHALALLLAAAPVPMPPPTIPPAALDDTLEVSGDAIDARQIETRMTVAVRVNGQGPYRFVVDSGADRSVIGADLARRLALPPEAAVTLHGMAGASRVATVRIDRLTVGASDIPDIVAPALAERHLGAQGLLGIDALAEQRLMLDFEKRTITVQDARKPPPASAGEIVVTARRRHGQLILTQVRVADRPIYAVIDTGSQVTIGNSALLARLGRHRPTTPVTLVSVTGQTIAAQQALLPEIRIGAVTLRGVPAAFADVPPFALFGLDRQPALLLGSDTLQAFRRVSLDFRARRVRFVLRR